MSSKIRVDKWLWTVRIFKSRTLATTACKNGKIKLNDKNLKAASLVGPGQIIQVHKNGFNLVFKINQLLKSRVSATLAAPCYENLTSEAEMNKFKSWFIGKAGAEHRLKGEGRPTKRERREIDEFKFEQYLEYLDFEEEESN